MTETTTARHQTRSAPFLRTALRRPPARALALALAVTTAAAPLAAQERALGPLIRHKPVTTAVRGVPLGVSALISGRGAPVERVTLYYTRSREASPSKVSMLNTSGDSYLGTLPSYHLARGDVMWYYIEAIDEQDEWSETSWQRITLVGSEEAARTPPTTVETGTTVPPVEPEPSTRKGPSRKSVIIGGAIVAGAAVAIAAGASSGGGGGGGGGGGSTSGDCKLDDVVGTWTGTNPSVAPGFVLNRNGAAVFFDAQGLGPDNGTWGLIDCVLTLAPLSNEVYRGSGNISSDRRSVTINGNTFTR